MLANVFLAIGALSAGTAVILGAFGAHGLKGRLSPSDLEVFQIGVQYHLIHSLAVCLLAVWCKSSNIQFSLSDMPGINLSVFLLGILFFSGSLYALSLGGPRWLGPITPLGGLFFICGWVLLAYNALRA
ncbi:MAG: DUF423 domain-containing protein [Pseudomonadales bacterium]|nr:DUF423 domain-containing protein [Pseudomonadales bacterium]